MIKYPLTVEQTKTQDAERVARIVNAAFDLFSAFADEGVRDYQKPHVVRNKGNL